MKDIILIEIKLFLTTILLSLFGLSYFNFEFSKLENYKGLKEILIKPYLYNMEGFVVICWYLLLATCVFFMINEIYKFIKENKITLNNVNILQNTTKKEFIH